MFEVIEAEQILQEHRQTIRKSLLSDVRSPKLVDGVLLMRFIVFFWRHAIALYESAVECGVILKAAEGMDLADGPRRII